MHYMKASDCIMSFFLTLASVILYSREIMGDLLIQEEVRNCAGEVPSKCTIKILGGC